MDRWIISFAQSLLLFIKQEMAGMYIISHSPILFEVCYTYVNNVVLINSSLVINTSLIIQLMKSLTVKLV